MLRPGRQGILPVLLGLLLGLGVAVGLSRFVSSLVYGIEVTDAKTYLVVAVALAIVSLGACLGPASKATREDPLAALKAE